MTRRLSAIITCLLNQLTYIYSHLPANSATRYQFCFDRKNLCNETTLFFFCCCCESRVVRVDDSATVQRVIRERDIQLDGIENVMRCVRLCGCTLVWWWWWYVLVGRIEPWSGATVARRQPPFVCFVLFFM